MKIITMTMIQRYALEPLVGAQKAPEGTKDKYRARRVLYRLLEKIEIDPKVRAQIDDRAKEVGDLVFNEFPQVAVDLETEEREQLFTICSEADLPTVAGRWLRPLMEQLEVR